MAYYESVYSGGDSSGVRQAIVHLYPMSGLNSTCQSGGTVSTALRDALDSLLNADSFDYYEILRFKIEETTLYAPDFVDPDEGTTTESQFKDYLRGDTDGGSIENGTGQNLYSQTGVHHLVHDNQNACDEDSGGYAPAGANGEGRSQSAFSQGLVSWAPVCDNNTSLTEAAAVQEPLHMLINPSHDDQWTGSDDDQHSLGKVISYNTSDIVTPMLTYHWDDSKSEVGEGDCPSTYDNRYASSHTPIPTTCSEKAAKNTADTELL